MAKEGLHPEYFPESKVCQRETDRSSVELASLGYHVGYFTGLLQW